MHPEDHIEAYYLIHHAARRAFIYISNDPNHMKLGPVKKVYTSDGHRSLDPESTLKTIEPLTKIAGITRVADITDLDRIGVPVFSSIRPSAQNGAVSIYNGKGLTKTEAKVSAIMEGIERYSAELRGERAVRASVDQMLSSQNALDPMELILPVGSAYYLRSQPVAWTKGIDINTMDDIWVPTVAVYHPYTSNLDLSLFRTNTNGLASGNKPEEAILHGICELIERDAWSLCEASRRIKGDILYPGKGAVQDLIDKFTTKGINIHLKDLTSDIGIPVIAAAADDVIMQDPALLSLGIGSHLDPEIAAIKALLEVAQSRLTQIHGAREDTVRGDTARKLGYERMSGSTECGLRNVGIA